MNRSTFLKYLLALVLLQRTASAVVSECADEPDWKHWEGGLSCATIEGLIQSSGIDLCDSFVNSSYNGKSVTEACCVCGGSDAIPAAPSNSPSSSPTAQPSSSFTPTEVKSDAPTTFSLESPSRAPSVTASNVRSATATSVPFVSPSTAPSSAPRVTASSIPSMTASVWPSVTASIVPSVAASSVPSVMASLVPSLTASSVPSMTASVWPSVTASIVPSVAASSVPSVMASLVPSLTASNVPSVTASVWPSVMASIVPSVTASNVPSATATSFPSMSPSIAPSSAPSATISNVPTSAPSTSLEPSSPPSNCVDTMEGWYDEDGPNFNCVWYSQNNYCANFGDYYENFNMTANEVCCSCGAGQRGDSTEPSQSLSTSLPPSSEPSQFPTMCQDDPEWDFEDRFGCGTVRVVVEGLLLANSDFDFCDVIADYTRNGKNAREACCACQRYDNHFVEALTGTTAPSMSVPTVLPSIGTSNEPSFISSGEPSSEPSFISSKPSAEPSMSPSLRDSDEPSSVLSGSPTLSPSIIISDTPSYAPSTAVTSILSEEMTVRPTIFPSKPFMCKNDKSYEYRSRNCQNIGWNEERRVRLCQVVEVQKSCPMTCGLCCEDDSAFTFTTNFGTEKRCAWIAKKDVRKERYCEQFKNETMVRSACQKTCNFCVAT